MTVSPSAARSGSAENDTPKRGASRAADPDNDGECASAGDAKMSATCANAVCTATGRRFTRDTEKAGAARSTATRWPGPRAR